MSECDLAITYQHLQYNPALTSPRISSWGMFLDKQLRARASQAALFVSDRMCDPNFVRRIAERAGQQSAFPKTWFSSSLASGDVGLVLFYEYLDRCFPDVKRNNITQQYLSLISADSQQTALTLPALFGGVGGVALALSLVSRGDARYQKALMRTNQGLCHQVLQRTWRRPEASGGVAYSDYDTIVGAAGVLAYLVSLEKPDALVQSAIQHLLKYLLWLTEPDQPASQERWYIPPDLLPTDLHRKHFPQGNFNCGLAHGIPGPLAALALTWLAGYRYPGMRESIAYVSNWMLQHQLTMPWGRDWPDTVPFAAASSSTNWMSLSASHSSWCYGAPGVSRALWLAGQALADESLCQVAVETIEGVLRRSIAQRAISSPNLCHGVAGLLQICLRFAQLSTSALIKESIPLLVAEMLDNFDSTSPLGFHDIEQNVLIDQPAWLTGAPGVAMALLAASTSVIPTWDRVLLIA